MFDYSFFALLFAIATTLAPAGASRVELQNQRHPEQSMVWTEAADGRWALSLNGRDVGSFVREGDVITHHTGQGAPDAHPLADLLTPGTLRRSARTIELRGGFAPARIEVVRDGGSVVLRDPTRHLLGTDLRLHHR